MSMCALGPVDGIKFSLIHFEFVLVTHVISTFRQCVCQITSRADESTFMSGGGEDSGGATLFYTLDIFDETSAHFSPA